MHARKHSELLVSKETLVKKRFKLKQKKLGDVTMATFSTPLPAPVKNDWLPTGENPRLSPPSPGGPRKNTPAQQVIFVFKVSTIEENNF